MTNPSRAKGTAAESAIVTYLRARGIDAHRHPPHGTKDVGDILIPGSGVVIEVKNCKSMDLAGWVDETATETANAGADLGVVWHKRRGKSDPADWYVTMTGAEFLYLLIGEGRGLR